MREFLKKSLPNFKDPIIFISSEFIPGCSKCNSSATIYYIALSERNVIHEQENIVKAQNHKFPVDVYVQYPIQKGIPKQFVVGTKKLNGEFQMVLRRVVE